MCFLNSNFSQYNYLIHKGVVSGTNEEIQIKGRSVLDSWSLTMLIEYSLETYKISAVINGKAYYTN